jgi:hypothetical protein
MAGIRKNTHVVMTTAKNRARNKSSTNRSNSKNSRQIKPTNKDASSNCKLSANKTRLSVFCPKKRTLKSLMRRKSQFPSKLKSRLFNNRSGMVSLLYSY